MQYRSHKGRVSDVSKINCGLWKTVLIQISVKIWKMSDLKQILLFNQEELPSKWRSKTIFVPSGYFPETTTLQLLVMVSSRVTVGNSNRIRTLQGPVRRKCWCPGIIGRNLRMIPKIPPPEFCRWNLGYESADFKRKWLSWITIKSDYSRQKSLTEASREVRETQSQRRTQFDITGFEDGNEGHQLRNGGSL